MNKKLFLLPLLAAAMVSCANEDPVVNNEPDVNGETETRYLAVNIIDNSAGTRAVDPTTQDYYEDGVGKENEVKTVRFYLFGGEGFKNTSVDATPSYTTGETPNVERKLEAVIVFEAPENSNEPLEIVAIVNPPLGLAESYVSPAKLQEEVGNYGNNGGENELFIMSNSVYVSESQEKVSAKVAQSYSSREEALSGDHPVDIYVERVVAKVRVKTSMEKATVPDEVGIFTLLSEKGENYNAGKTITASVYNYQKKEFETKDIYLKLQGWNVTGTAKHSRLVKKVNPVWEFNDWTTSWNYPAYHRSFWAVNPLEGEKAVNDKSKLTFGDFNVDQATKAAKLTLTNESNSLYVQENASWDLVNGYKPGYATKLIVAGQLVDDKGVAIDLAWWKGTYYLKDGLLQTLATESNLYTSEDGQSFTPMTSNDIEFKTAKEANVTGADKHYYSYAQYKEPETTPDTRTWYKKTGDGQYVKLENEGEGNSVKDQINKILIDLKEAKIWDGGNTYYWSDITHLGSGEYGATGIVRNHIYDYDITSFVGLGVPVLNPDEEIDPEEPNDPEYAFIAAKINILSWRLVKHNDTQLGW